MARPAKRRRKSNGRRSTLAMGFSIILLVVTAGLVVATQIPHSPATSFDLRVPLVAVQPLASAVATSLSPPADPVGTTATVSTLAASTLTLPVATPSLTSTPGHTASPTQTRPTVTLMPTPVALARASRFAPVGFQPDAELSAKVAQRLSSVSGHLGVAIKDLNTGRGVLIDPDSEFEAASLFKLPVMYEVFKQRDQGRLAFSESLTLTARHVAYDLGTIDRPVGSNIELREALERMVTISDNSSAILLTDRVSATAINQDMQSLGLRHTRVRLDDLMTSPGDLLDFFEMLARGRAMSADTSGEMIHLLARQRVNDRIPRLLPGSATVAHKTGNLPGVVNDAGIVYAPDAAFVIAVLVDGTQNEAEAARAIADLALMAYQHFRGQAGGAPDVQLPPTEVSRPATATPTRSPTATVTPAPSATTVAMSSPAPDLNNGARPTPATLPTAIGRESGAPSGGEARPIPTAVLLRANRTAAPEAPSPTLGQ